MSENKITEVALTEEAFISFKDDERNATLVSDGKYEVVPPTQVELLVFTEEEAINPIVEPSSPL